MRVVNAGVHGNSALLLERLLAGRGAHAVGLIRTPGHVADVQNVGAEAVVCDLEAAGADEVAGLLSGADAVGFAARHRARSGAPRKGRDARAAAVLSSVQVSPMVAAQRRRPGTVEVWAPYIAAKTAAEADLRAGDLDWTIR